MTCIQFSLLFCIFSKQACLSYVYVVLVVRSLQSVSACICIQILSSKGDIGVFRSTKREATKPMVSNCAISLLVCVWVCVCVCGVMKIPYCFPFSFPISRNLTFQQAKDVSRIHQQNFLTRLFSCSFLCFKWDHSATYCFYGLLKYVCCILLLQIYPGVATVLISSQMRRILNMTLLYCFMHLTSSL